MIGYIPIRQIEYEGTDQGVLDPSPVFASELEAEAAASVAFDDPRRRIYGGVWEIDLDSDPRIARVNEILGELLCAHQISHAVRSQLERIAEALARDEKLSQNA